MKYACKPIIQDVKRSLCVSQLNQKNPNGKASSRQARWVVVTMGGLQLDVVHDITKGLGTLLHLRQLRLAQFLADQVRDALLADADRDTEENLI